MTTQVYIPNSIADAEAHLRQAQAAVLQALPAADFAKAWSSVCYLNPGLHPDGFEEEDSGWPESLRKFATEAWRRADSGEIHDEELYPSDASHAGLIARVAGLAVG